MRYGSHAHHARTIPWILTVFWDGEKHSRFEMNVRADEVVSQAAVRIGHILNGLQIWETLEDMVCWP